MRGTTRNNVLANLAGRSCTAVLSLLFVPVYLRLLGVEAYGLVGLFAAAGPELPFADRSRAQNGLFLALRFLAFGFGRLFQLERW